MIYWLSQYPSLSRLGISPRHPRRFQLRCFSRDFLSSRFIAGKHNRKPGSGGWEHDLLLEYGLHEYHRLSNHHSFLRLILRLMERQQWPRECRYRFHGRVPPSRWESINNTPGALKIALQGAIPPGGSVATSVHHNIHNTILPNIEGPQYHYSVKIYILYYCNIQCPVLYCEQYIDPI